MVTNRIACFLTCGYTEAGAMQSFLKKINDKYEYRQYLPNKTIKKKGDPKNISSDINGLTGTALLEKIYSIIEKHAAEISQYSGILIEDDLDGKFHDMTDSDVKVYVDSIREKIHSVPGKPVPVFLFFASPEIESWFIADWDNGFGYLYTSDGCVTDVDPSAKTFFTHHLQQYINLYILKEYRNDIEDYGYFGETYHKLSDQLIDTVQTAVKVYIASLPNTNQIYSKQISASRDLYYSKKLHGDRMLRNLNPSTVADKCRHFFLPAFNRLAAFGLPADIS